MLQQVDEPWTVKECNRNDGDVCSVPFDILFIFSIVTVCNVLSAFYLYKKAARSKVEWTLFGAIGNLNALFFFWLFGNRQRKLQS